MHTSCGSQLRFLWIIDFEYATRLHHGALLRYFNLSPELIAQGHTVTFAVNFLDRDREPGIRYLQYLKAQGVVTDFVEANFEVPMWRARAAWRLIHPILANAVLRPSQREFAAGIDAIAQECNTDVIVISSVHALFLPQESKIGSTFIYDIGDSQALFEYREFWIRMREFDFPGAVRTVNRGVHAYTRERYYGRLPVLKIVVSPADKKALDKISGRPDRSVVVLNGVKSAVPLRTHSKIPGRIIFTGNMDFEPNYEAALWFLNQVFPLVLKLRPDATLVIAGANPIRKLVARASKNVIVTGFVEDLSREIACSEIFVAPLKSGGGFRNKILEAIVNRTAVVATSIAVEFLPKEILNHITVADSPAEMLEAIMAVWQDPQKAEAQGEVLHELVTAQFRWASRAAEIAELASKEVARSRTTSPR